MAIAIVEGTKSWIKCFFPSTPEKSRDSNFFPLTFWHKQHCFLFSGKATLRKSWWSSPCNLSRRNRQRTAAKATAVACSSVCPTSRTCLAYARTPRCHAPKTPWHGENSPLHPPSVLPTKPLQFSLLCSLFKCRSSER